jgi:ferredoxin
MPSSCTVGNCGECLVALRAGTVVMAEPNCLSPEQRAAGAVLTCIAQPTSPITIDMSDGPLP